MKTILILIFFIHGSFAYSQSNSKSEDQQIQDLVKNMFDDLFSNFDSGKIPAYMTEDFILLEDGMIWDNQIIQGYLDGQKAKGNLPKRENRFEFIQIKVFGNRASAAYKNWATISRNGTVIREAHWLESITAIKTESGWKLEMMHSTPVQTKVQ